MLSLTIFVDFLNGLFPSFGIGTVYRFGLILVCLWIVVRNSGKLTQLVVPSLLFLILNILFSAVRHGSISGIAYDLKMAMRVMTSIMIFYAVSTLYRRGRFTAEMVDKIIENNLWYTPALFIITKILNIGSVSYTHNQVGFKSVFLSLNSVNIALIVLYTYAVFKIFNSKHPWRWSAASVYVAIPMLMLGTKTSIAIILVVPLICIFMHLNTRKGRRIFFMFVGIVAVAAMLWLKTLLTALSGVLSRQMYLFENRDLISYVFSGRNWMLTSATEYYFETNSLIEYLFGQGYFYSHNQLAQISSYLSTAEVRPIEMDWADLLLAYGPIALLFTYGYAMRILHQSRRYWKNRRIQAYFVTSVILLGFSALAGHVYTEAISSTFLAFVLCGTSLNTADIKKERLNRKGLTVSRKEESR